MTMKAINPATGELIKEYPEYSPSQVKSILEKAHAAYEEWHSTTFVMRAKLMRKAATVLRENAKDYGQLMTLEMGKPLKSGISEAEKCAWCCEYYAENAEQFLKNELIPTDAKKSFITYQPLGVVLAVMPWNFPFWQVFRFAAPGLMAGNVAVLKHASNVPGCAMAIEAIFKEAGFPENVFTTLLIGSKQVGSVIEDKHIAAVTLTGSTAAGQEVAAKAGSLIKKTVLELGGSDPYIVLADADIEKSARECANSRLINSGQSCIAAKRFIIVESVLKEFLHYFVQYMQQAVMGDPMREDTIIGPQAREDLRDKLHQQVQESIAKGAKCILGGKIPSGKGAFYPATVLIDVKKGMPAYEEELFGPVAAVISARDEQEAIQIANDVNFGLGAAVFTQDLNKGEVIAATQLQAGSCFVNAFVRSDPRLPFGGIKQSGYGRELSYFGIREFVNIKSVYIGGE